MTLLRLRPYRLLKATGNLRAQAIPLADVQHTKSKTADLNQCVQNFLHVNDAQLCLVEVLDAKGNRPAPFVPQGSRAERLAAAGIEVERAAKSPWDMTREDAIAAGIIPDVHGLGPIDGPDGAA